MKLLKYFLITIGIILLSSSKIYAQKLSGEVTYKYKIYEDIFNIDSISKDRVEILRDVLSEIDKSNKYYQDSFKFTLIFNEDTSNYFWQEMLQIEDGEHMIYAKILTGANNFYYINVKDKISLIERDFLGSKLIIKDSLNTIHWNVSNKSKQIGNYTCFKATTIKRNKSKNNKVEAWFTPQIPVGFGPKEYAGLPGLILELKEGKAIYYATSIKLNTKKIKNYENQQKEKL